MSTKFGILKEKYEPMRVEIEKDSEYAGSWCECIFTEIAFRNNIGNFRWEYNDMLFLPEELDDALRVYPLDNSAQGVYTIGDIKKKMKEQEKVKDVGL